MSDRLGPPFPKPVEALESVFNTTAYIRKTYEIGLDPVTGEIILSSEHSGAERRDTLGNFMTSRDFYDPTLDPKHDVAAAIDVAMMFGMLFAQLQAQEAQDG